MIIDFHSHILPGIDDGSISVEMSKAMLKAARTQKIDVMVATPHFYAHKTEIDHFIEKRQQAYESIREEVERYYAPEILLGAEILFFSGISNIREISKLCVEDTDVLLIEMPFEQWTEKMVAEIETLTDRGFEVVIAHIERYLGYQRKKQPLLDLLELPVYPQINAESLTHWGSRRKILPYIEEGKIRLLGSDCHNLTERAQHLEEAREVLASKAGSDILEDMDALGKDLLGYY